MWDCIAGGLRTRMVFSPDKSSDISSAALLNGRVAREGVVSTVIQPAGIAPDAAAHADLEPPTADVPLLAAGWYTRTTWKEMRKIHWRTFVQIPQRLENAFCEAVGVAVQEIRAAEQGSARELAGWKALFLLPWLLLARPADNDSDQSCASLLMDRLDRFWQGDVAAMYRETLVLTASRKQERPRQELSDAMRAKRVKTLSRAGEEGRALQAVHENKRMVITEDVVTQLSDLFPAALMEDTEENAPMLDDFVAIDEDRLQGKKLKDLQRLPRLSEPGPLGFRNEHLVLLAKSTEHGPDLAQVLARLAVGKAHREAIEFLRGGRLCPLPKPDGGIRPLTLSNVLRRACLRTLVRERAKENAVAVGCAQ